MTLRKFDDATGVEINLADGLEIAIALADGTTLVKHYATWDHVPARFLDGTVQGQAVAVIQIRDLTLQPPSAETANAKRAAARKAAVVSGD